MSVRVGGDARYWWRRWACRAQGWCPACNSSPPEPACGVCDGSYDYGPRLTKARRRLWLNRWDYYNHKPRRDA